MSSFHFAYPYLIHIFSPEISGLHNEMFYGRNYFCITFFFSSLAHFISLFNPKMLLLRKMHLFSAAVLYF